MSYDTTPSDVGDTKPVDATATLEQSLQEYYKSKNISLPKLDDFDPQLEVKPPAIIEREVLPGLIIKIQSQENTTITVKVLLQDGRVVTAYLYAILEGQTIKKNDPCIIVRGKTDNEWYCFAQKYEETKRLELYQLVDLPILDGTGETRNWWCHGKKLIYDSETEEWDAEDEAIRLQFPMWWSPDVGPGIVGARVWVWGSKYIITHPEGLWRFELKGELVTSESAEAYLVKPDGTTDETVTFTVYDLLGNYEGVIGDKGYCKYLTDSQKFEVISIKSLGVDGGNCWVGLNNDYELIHLTPMSSSTPANCVTIHEVFSPCGLYFDDAGHLIGYLDYASNWVSPWGIVDPR